MPAPTILAIIGSASPDSSNHKLIAHLQRLAGETLDIRMAEDLAMLPHFDPALSLDAPPLTVQRFRDAIAGADAVLIATPEYIFSIPARLKNALEWCVATTVFSGKPAAMITASASGAKGHDELQLILRTLGARLSAATTLLISGVKGKLAEDGFVTDGPTATALERFPEAILALMHEPRS